MKKKEKLCYTFVCGNFTLVFLCKVNFQPRNDSYLILSNEKVCCYLIFSYALIPFSHKCVHLVLCIDLQKAL
jgi:hypothetical protein